jgi:hypothetical protein
VNEQHEQAISQEEFFHILGSLFFEKYQLTKQILLLRQQLTEAQASTASEKLKEVKK